MAYIKVLGPELNVSTLGPQGFTGNTAQVATNKITVTNRFTNGQALVYTVAAGNTALTGLTNGVTYYAVNSVAASLSLANAFGGGILTISTACTSVAETGHQLFGVNNMNNAQTLRILNLGAANSVHICAANNYEYANLTSANSEVLYLTKAMTDTVWTNGSIVAAAVSIRG
jgi:hypothetical protein